MTLDCCQDLKLQQNKPNAVVGELYKVGMSMHCDKSVTVLLCLTLDCCQDVKLPKNKPSGAALSECAL